MKSKKIIMVNKIEDKLCLPVYELIKYNKYYKLKQVSASNIPEETSNLCYLLPCDTLVYDYLFPNDIEILKQVLNNIYILEKKEKTNNKIKKLKNKI